ncbi:type II toxin-antitoxin system VapC family toxin [Trujillonella humicola]|uniref:type II toxin-antitoxin system VapC family toxin n=1 Tax=Trujillonella humicola TaxID=3383699 RepID=UPI003906749A
MIVADASTVAAAVLDAGAAGDEARQQLLTDEAHAPHLLDVEVLSVVRRHTLRGLLDSRAARGGVAALRDLPVVRHGHDPLLDRALELRDSMTAYDAVYVALAEVLGATLVTGDRGLSRAAGLRCAVTVIG